MVKYSPWSNASEKGIDSLADWLIPTLDHDGVPTLLSKNIDNECSKSSSGRSNNTSTLPHSSVRLDI